MKVTNIRKQSRNNKVILLADIVLKKSTETVFFEIDKKYEDFLIADATPFLTSLVIPCLLRGEDLIIEGTVDKDVLKGIKEIINIYKEWGKAKKEINIKVSNTSSVITSAKEQAVFFSGGVDSFYTYFRNLENNNKIKYLIAVNGFDVALSETKLWDNMIANINKFAEESKSEVIEVRTDIRRITELYSLWDFAHGGALAAVGLILRRGIGKVYISSSRELTNLRPWGTHPKVDPKWSTKYCSFINYGGENNRFNKIKLIADYPAVQKYLKVCYVNPDEKYNCGKCDKCIRTMTSLEITGVLDKVKTFPPLELHIFNEIYLTNVYFHNENLKQLHPESKLYKALKHAIKRSSSPIRILKYKLKILFKLITNKTNQRFFYLEKYY